MTKYFRHFWTTMTGASQPKASDFSDFFTKSSGDKAKVIRQVLREANEEQRRVVEKYQKSLVH
jgi:hypothetical protein